MSQLTPSFELGSEDVGPVGSIFTPETNRTLIADTALRFIRTQVIADSSPFDTDIRLSFGNGLRDVSIQATSVEIDADLQEAINVRVPVVEQITGPRTLI